MPAYDYRCTECAHEFEIVQKFSDDPLTSCPECNGQLRKVFSAVGVVFKGSGFYSTDNRSRKTSAAASKSATKTTDKGSSTKSETTSTPAKAEAAAKPAAN